jgi:hypothetical protein
MGEAHITDQVLEPGTIVRMVNADGTMEPFSDCVILKVTKAGPGTPRTYTLARPYAMATSTSTSSPSPLTGVETFEVNDVKLARAFVIPLTPRGEPYIMET